MINSFRNILTLGFFIIITSQCHTPVSNIILDIDANNTQDVINLKLSDLADSFKIVPLETTNECLLDDLTEYYCTEDYILAYSKNGVYKFSPSGKFIKKLFGTGRGPNEFVSLLRCIYTVDETNDILYINDQSHKDIYLRYDLKSEQFLEPVRQCFSAFGSFYIIRDSLIIVSNSLNREYAFYYQDFDGKFISGMANTKKMMSGQEETLQGGRFAKSGSDYYYSFLYDDTLFKIEDNKLIPYLALNFKASREYPPTETLENRNGEVRLIVFQPSPGFFTILVLVDDFQNLNLKNRGIGEEKSYYIFLDIFTGKASRINSYTDNFIGEKKDAMALSNIDFLSPFFLKLLPNGRIIKSYHPDQVKKAIEKGLNYKDFSVEINEQLLKFNENLQETDNPILLIGKIKDKI